MPQLDKFTFFSQVFYLLIIFFAFYLLASRLILPRLFAVMAARRQRLSFLKSRNKFLGINKDLIESYESKVLSNYLSNIHKALNKIHVENLSNDFNSKLNNTWSNALNGLKNKDRSFIRVLKNFKRIEYLLNNNKLTVFTPSNNDVFIVNDSNLVNKFKK